MSHQNSGVVSWRAERTQFVGLEVSGGVALPVGAHAVESVAGKRRSIGFVTSSYFSPTLKKPIATGLIERGLTRMGETIELVHLGQPLRAVITNPCAFDIDGARLNA